MKQYPITPLDTTPTLLQEIPQQPKELRYRGALPPSTLPLIAIVGSRKYTSYGKAVVGQIVAGLRGYEVGIVSGLAIGIDGLAHEAALANNLYTLAVPGGGLADTVLYPAQHKQLAYRILEAGGTLLSEFTDTQRVARWTFPQRNRIVCGLAQATVVIEAAEQSGSLITARLAVDYNRELFVVPGDIFSPASRGCHQFLKLGATPLTDAHDIIDTLKLKPKTKQSIATAHALPVAGATQALLNLLTEPCEQDELIRRSGLQTNKASALLMELELAGHITVIDGLVRRL